MKKFILALLLCFNFAALTACDKDTDDTPNPDIEQPNENADTIAPGFKDIVDGKLISLEHLKGEEVDLLEGVGARDNVTSTANINIEVSNYNGYNKDEAGEYEITYKATDEAGNSSEIKRDITVLETLTKEFLAMRIGDKYAQMSYNDTTALWNNGGTLNVRFTNTIQVMDTDFYLSEVAKYSEAWAGNGGQPHLPWSGIAAIFDSNMELAYGRFVANFTLDQAREYVDGQIVEASADDGWYISAGGSTTKPNGSLAGLDAKIASSLNGGKGYVVFVSSAEPQTGRSFLYQNLYSSQAGGSTLGTPDIDYSNLDVEFNIDYKENVRKPDPMATPTMEISKHTLTVNSEDTANLKDYTVTFEANGQETVTQTLTTSKNEILLSEFVKENNKLVLGVEYDITVVANTKDVYAASDSLKSEAIKYTFVELEMLTAADLTIDGQNLNWTANPNAQSYNVYVRVASNNIKLANVTTNTYAFGSDLNLDGTVAFYVLPVAAEDSKYLDALYDSSKELLVPVTELLTFTSGDVEASVLPIKTVDYLARRESSDATGFAGSTQYGAFLLTDIHTITNEEFNSKLVEAFSVIVLLDSDGNVKLVRSILSKQEYLSTNESTNGWAMNDTYASNGSQLDGLKNIVAEGDQLLVFKNGNIVNIKYKGEDVSVQGRQFGAHIFVKAGEEILTEAWRGTMDTFINCSEVEFTIE